MPAKTATTRRPTTPRQPRQKSTRERLEKGVGIAHEFGLSSHSLERFLFWWKHLGLRRAAGMFVVIVLPVLNAEWTKSVADHAVRAYSEAHDIDIEVGDWDGSLFGTHATAHNVVLETTGPYARPELFKAETITIKLSLWRRLRAGHWIKDIIVEKPSVYVERTLAGRWNWSDVFDTGETEPADSVRAVAMAGRQTAASIAADHIQVDDLHIVWVENLPGNSGSGLINASTATLYVDDVKLRLDHVGEPEEPTRIQMEGRTADGRISIDGRIAPSASVKGTSTVYVENVGVAAFARLAPASLLVPVAGSVTGRIELAVADDRVDCKADLQVRGYQLTVARGSGLTPEGSVALERELQDFRGTRRVLAACDGDPRQPTYRVEHAIQAAVTRAVVADGSPALQKAAYVDDQRAQGQPPANALDALGLELARRSGIPAARLLTASALSTRGGPTEAQAGSALVKGLKGAGSGLKHLFGGGKRGSSRHR